MRKKTVVTTEQTTETKETTTTQQETKQVEKTTTLKEKVQKQEKERKEALTKAQKEAEKKTKAPSLHVCAGKSNFATPTAETLRKVLGAFSNARHEMNDKITYYKDSIKDLQKKIDNLNESIENFGTDGVIYSMTLDELYIEKNNTIKLLEETEEKKKEISTELRTRYNNACEVVPESLYSAYKDYRKELNFETLEVYKKEIASFLFRNGVQPAEETIEHIKNIVTGGKTSTSKQLRQENIFFRDKSLNEFRTMFLSELIDKIIPKNLIQGYKYNYIPEAERKQKSKERKKRIEESKKKQEKTVTKALETMDQESLQKIQELISSKMDAIQSLSA